MRNRKAFEILFTLNGETRLGCWAETAEGAEKRCKTFRNNPRKYGRNVTWSWKPAA